MLSYATVQTRTHTHRYHLCPAGSSGLLVLFFLSLFSSLSHSLQELLFPIPFQSLMTSALLKPTITLTLQKKNETLNCELKFVSISQLFLSPSVLSVSTRWPSSCSRQTLLQILNSTSSYFYRNPVPSITILSIGSFQLVINRLKYLPFFKNKKQKSLTYLPFFSTIINILLIQVSSRTTLLCKLLCFLTSNHSLIHRKLVSVSNVLLNYFCGSY